MTKPVYLSAFGLFSKKSGYARLNNRSFEQLVWLNKNVGAVKKVMTMNMVDPKRVGVVGHSWGGFDAAYLATHTNGVFAAAVAGAPITNLVSNYGNHHWSSGIAETDHIETGQQRMEVPLWEDLDRYIANSAVFNAQNMTVPLLIEVADNDGTVFWHQGVELFNIARRARRNVVLLQYNGEDHGLRQKKNQIDYQRRILAWFGHYLKGQPAEPWITNGESFLSRQEELGFFADRLRCEKVALRADWIPAQFVREKARSAISGQHSAKNGEFLIPT